jgi:hypothetical protein
MARTEQYVTGIDPVLSRLRAVDAALPRRDGVAVFHGVFLTVTEEFAGRNPAGARRDDAVAVLYALCAERYLAVVDTGAAVGRAPACWRPLLRFRRHPGPRPVQFALAGLNAHVGHDLALAVVDACRTLGCEPADLEGAFEAVGDLVASLEERIHEELTPGPDQLRITDPLTHLIGSWSLDRARDASWATARALWVLRELPDLTREFAERMDAASGVATRLLLTPLPP